MCRGSTPFITAFLVKARRGALISAQSSQSKGIAPQLRNLPNRKTPSAYRPPSQPQPSQGKFFSVSRSKMAASRCWKKLIVFCTVLMAYLLKECRASIGGRRHPVWLMIMENSCYCDPTEVENLHRFGFDSPGGKPMPPSRRFLAAGRGYPCCVFPYLITTANTP